MRSFSKVGWLFCTLLLLLCLTLHAQDKGSSSMMHRYGLLSVEWRAYLAEAVLHGREITPQTLAGLADIDSLSIPTSIIITDLSGLCFFPRLRKLYVNNNTHLVSLKGLPSARLEVLEIQHCPIATLKGLDCCTRLHRLNIIQTNISSLSPLWKNGCQPPLEILLCIESRIPRTSFARYISRLPPNCRFVPDWLN